MRFATAKSALVDSSNHLIEDIADADTTTELLFTKDAEGNVSLTRGGTTAVKNNSVDTGLSSFNFLSWREISTVD